jgi:hypothetical protein
MFTKWKSFNHNKVAALFAVFTIAMLILLVKYIPAISIAPIETWGRSTEKLAIFTVAWTIALRFLGGWKYSVTEDAKQSPYGMTMIACALIIGTAIVLSLK